MKIITTPMCQEILRLAGVSGFKVIKDQDYSDADVAVVLSETKFKGKPPANVIKIKLNTFSQIKESIRIVSDLLGTEILDYNITEPAYFKYRNENREIKVRVYSKFLEEIVEDLGFIVVADDDYDYLVYPDYLKDKIKNEVDDAALKAIELPSHKNAPLNPIKRAEIRYQILEKKLCMKYKP